MGLRRQKYEIDYLHYFFTKKWSKYSEFHDTEDEFDLVSKIWTFLNFWVPCLTFGNPDKIIHCLYIVYCLRMLQMIYNSHYDNGCQQYLALSIPQS